MPYTTRYHIGWNKPTGPTIEEVSKELAQRVQKGQEDDMSAYSPGCWETILEGDVNTTWFNHQMDMATIVSQKWPETRFRLQGQGDDDNDVWAEFFLGGKVQRVLGETRFPEFDPDKLTNPKLPAK